MEEITGRGMGMRKIGTVPLRPGCAGQKEWVLGPHKHLEEELGRWAYAELGRGTPMKKWILKCSGAQTVCDLGIIWASEPRETVEREDLALQLLGGGSKGERVVWPCELLSGGGQKQGLPTPSIARA